MNIALGIDTGGTFTDAVLVDHDTGAVLAGAKSLTTRHDLAIGIAGAIADVFRARPSVAAEDVTLVALSTTLATNTLAEGQRGAVRLLLIGYDPELMERFAFNQALATDDVVYLRGGHDALGNEAAPLDEEAARAAILSRRHSVEAFAVSGYFSVRNPDHERRVQALIAELTGLPVTCGHELTSRLDAVRRATTAALNAHLILPLRELIRSVERTLHEQGIRAPLMVVKGDGSLVRADWAMRRPIETILSGPAASVVGAWHLAGRRDVWVVDVGGTTTDIAALRDGLPRLNTDGAQVAGWRTMVEAVDVHTTGLGGDSHVRFDVEGRLQVGPRRVIPLSLLAHEHPQVSQHLQRMVGLAPGQRPAQAGDFLVLGRHADVTLTAMEKELLVQLAAGPQAIAALTAEMSRGWLLDRCIKGLEGRGLVRRAGFTPTDALHVLGVFTRWRREAARLGAALLAEERGLSVDALCRQTVRAVSTRISSELVTKILQEEAGVDHREAIAECALLNLGLNGYSDRDLSVDLTLHRPLVAIGAPVTAYLPQVAARLHTELVIPPFAEVANAVGAVAGGVVQRLRVLINPLEEGGPLRAHLPDGVRDFGDLDAAIAYAQAHVSPLVAEMARQAGAEHIELHVERRDERASTANGGEVYLATELVFTATGRPSMARR